jgi:hypothetical protein
LFSDAAGSAKSPSVLFEMGAPCSTTDDGMDAAWLSSGSSRVAIGSRHVSTQSEASWPIAIGFEDSGPLFPYDPDPYMTWPSPTGLRPMLEPMQALPWACTPSTATRRHSYQIEANKKQGVGHSAQLR